MIISIGILAWNEENSIGAAVHSLLEQTLIRELADHAEDRLEIVVVPNGCSDHTDAKAAEALRTGTAAIPTERFSWRVESLREAGKVSLESVRASAQQSGCRLCFSDGCRY
jgi:hypothetical protein